MSSQQASAREGEGALKTPVDGAKEGTNDSDQELAHLPTGPPFDLNNFPFTFEHARDTSRSAHIEPDVRVAVSQRKRLNKHANQRKE